ncbi:PRC-barrel domain-containing protein [Halocatena pleomorpha]|uniref:Photosystem reaction center subunit H n=1 Tax=Halocatena pleomorpha TaxID=1785090 RepID=A0A3P3RG29_9EURY|nr:PRC-barrel domain-containing protein [Halocatena pleomorpha]RRJ32335.1 photosystem reaction center subunit H [Halocatena pleomorpha]
MPTILAENLSEKAITGSDGTHIGILHNITMDVENGQLENLIVDPRADGNENFATDDYGHYLIPVDRVTAVKDHVIVRR